MDDEVEIEYQDLRTVLAPFLGMKAWGIRLGVGSFLFLNFGTRHVSEPPPEGEWVIWIYLCNWTLLRAGTEVVDSDSDRNRITSMIRCLEGEKLEAVHIDLEEGETRFVFSGDLQ